MLRWPFGGYHGHSSWKERRSLSLTTRIVAASLAVREATQYSKSDHLASKLTISALCRASVHVSPSNFPCGVSGKGQWQDLATVSWSNPFILECHAMAYQLSLNGNVFLSCACGGFDMLMKASSDSSRRTMSAVSSREESYSGNESFTSSGNESFTSPWACVHNPLVLST